MKQATLQEKYNSLPHSTKLLIEEYVLAMLFEDDCFDTLLSIVPEKECSIKALAEAYAEYHHDFLTAVEKLKAVGVDEKEAYEFGFIQKSEKVRKHL